MRRRRVLIGGMLAVLAVAPIAARVSARRVERYLTAQIRQRAAEARVSVGAVRFSWLEPLRLEGVTVEPVANGSGRLTVDVARVSWRLLGGRDLRSHVMGFTLHGLRAAHDPLTVDWPQTTLDVLAWDREASSERIRLRQRPSGGEVEVVWPVGRGSRRETSLALASFDLSGARVAWQGQDVLEPGRWSGRLRLARAGSGVETEAALSGEGVRVALPRTLGLGSGDYGAPTAVRFDWSVLHDGRALDIRRAAARLDGLAVDARGRLHGPLADLQADLALSARTELGAAFQTTGLLLPPSLRTVAHEALGSARLDVSVRGRLADRATLRIVPRLRFASAPESVHALRYLRGPFRYRPHGSPQIVIDVREGARDFVPLREVPSLFVQALLTSEDAGFFGHHGIDVAEIPVAWASNVERGRPARGASTITQQLAKNLFLSGDKTYARKLTEAALALVLDAAVPKTRLLEIYLNVIEWGPGLHGLGPAAGHYFGKTAAQLTPKETAFLVCLIPNPVRYHQAHAAGRVGPGMEQLMADLLAKLHSSGALGEEEYATALARELVFRPEGT